jgi:putative mRNA 3-end processing factor
MKIRCMGACQEVGRSAFAVNVGEKDVVLDYGVMVNHHVGFPMHIPPKQVEAIILTHAHLDHVGSVPLFFVHGGVPIYGVQPTFTLTTLIIKDFLKLSGYYLPYEYIDLQTMLKHEREIQYRAPIDVGDAHVTLVNAGHIPGSAQTLIEYEGKRLLYTADFNRQPTRLVDGADPEYYKNLDGIIIEGTYATEDHPARDELEKEFVSKVTEVVERKGTVLVPAFGIGRSQELLTVLSAHNFEHPVFVDGMALDAMDLLLKFPEALRDARIFERASKTAHWVENWHDRRKAAKTPGVIISPAGMLKGGASVFYMENIAQRRDNAIFMVSFQVPGSPGRILLERKKFVIHGRARPVEAQIERFDFSSHGGKRELELTLSELDKKTKVFVVHGAEGNCKTLAEWASKEMGLEATAPKTGDLLEL